MSAAKVDAHRGQMIVFNSNPWRRLTAFHCGDAPRAVVIIGGQSDGFFSLNYIESLTIELVKAGWSVVQALFSSWYSAYGQATLENDNEDLDQLLGKLKQMGITEVCLLGFHTGAQDVLSFMQDGHNAKMVSRIILQGGVFDPAVHQENSFSQQTRDLKDKAKSLIFAGRGNEILPEEHVPVSISAFRYMSLGYRHGVQDFFAPWQDVDEMSMVVGHLTLPLLVLFCLSDRYSPTREERAALLDKMQKSTPGFVRAKWLEATCDEQLNFLRGMEEEFTHEIVTFLSVEDRKAADKAADVQREQEAEERRRRSVVFQAKGGGMKRSPSQVSVTSTGADGTQQP
eukprot:TRINITY_DN4215_c0_g3_i2.p1 TRINITY_DN4215_c0_g3~~TRINITY_DN4215_c0_g3_i2.p1  ORF type:complete len:375 (+),score=128.06 TRINITY_DN4215_c0_g3_i2:102-1127(+)